jgi:hypothetical protein
MESYPTRKWLILGIFLGITVSWICVPHLFPADVDWTIKKQLNLEVPPLDISASVDGRWIFILVPREILVYSVSEDKVVNQIPVDKAFDKLTHSARSNTLVLSSQSEKTLKIIQLELIHKIDISGLPFKGPENAPVTMAVFGDYQ